MKLNLFLYQWLQQDILPRKGSLLFLKLAQEVLLQLVMGQFYHHLDTGPGQVQPVLIKELFHHRHHIRRPSEKNESVKSRDLILLKNKRFGSEKIWQKKSWKVLIYEIDDFHFCLGAAKIRSGHQ